MRIDLASRASVFLIALVPNIAGACAGKPPVARVEVRNADEMPQRAYRASGPALELIKDDARFLPLVDRYLADALEELRLYRIESPDALKKHLRGISSAYLAKGDLPRALKYAEQARELEIKDGARVSIGLLIRARIAAEKESGSRSLDDPKFVEALRRHLREAYAAIPPADGRDFLVTVRGQAALTPAMLEQSISASMDPQLVVGRGEISRETLRSLIDFRDALGFRIKVAPIAAEIAAEVLAKQEAPAPEDKWGARLFSLAPGDAARPVTVAIWDTGIDTSLYPQNMWVNPREILNGKDDDENGFIDDVHGISFSGGSLPIVGTLASTQGLSGDRDELIGYFAGQLEVTAGIDGPRARAVQEHLKAMTPDRRAIFSADMSNLFFYVHGTHVAGVAVDGNPFVRVVSVADSSMAAGPSELADPVAYGRKWADFCMRNVEYLRKANVRVVNMSWANSPRECRELLEMFGIGANPDERRRLGRAMFEEMRSGLERAIRSAPEMLFVTVAGNDDEDVDFRELIPAGLSVPNLVTLGAVDSADRLTTFTNTGSTVRLFANGHLIESFLPGGARVKWSGTSLAAPQVVNLAAKLLALRPELTTEQLLDLIRSNADPLPGHPGLSIVHPKRTLDAMRAARS